MKKYTTVARLLLANAIIGVLLCVPFLANMVNVGGLIDLAAIVLSILILVKGKGDANIKKASSILMIIASLINGLGLLVALAAAGTAGVVSSTSTAAESGAAVGAALGAIGFLVIFGFISWVIRIIGTIFAFIEYNKTSKLTNEDIY